jgi:hypothetical protein
MNPTSQDLASETQSNQALISEGVVPSVLNTNHDNTVHTQAINALANQLARIGDELTLKYDYSKQVNRMARSMVTRVSFHALLALIHDG